MKNKYYITTAIPYANSDPHIGFAYELLSADVMARYQRLLGKDVYFLTGTDEHGQKMYKTAKEQGRDVFEFASEKSAKFLNLADQWDIANDDFIRTTEERHISAAQTFWEASFKNGDIFKKEYSGFYCVGCESYKTEKDLVDGKCPDHGVAPEILKEENYFFKLSKYQKQLEELFDKNPEFVYPANRYNEMRNIIKDGLSDISISRSKDKLPWGIPVPNDPGQVMYVWFDALTNYITALGYGTKDNKLYKKFWPADAHVIGKEINRFHSLLWPAMLMSAGLDLPKQIAVHGWITVDGQKMSKSVGNVISPFDLIEKYPLEAVRYFFCREIPFDNDGDFTYAKFDDRYNGDLANGLGNLTNRVVVMIEKYCGGAAPKTDDKDDKLVKFVSSVWADYEANMEKFCFGHALESVFKLVTYCDQQISERQPWVLAKEGKKNQVNGFLNHLAEALRQVAVMISPIMPDTSGKILVQFGLEPIGEFKKSFTELKKWRDMSGLAAKNTGALFPRLETK